MQLIEAESAQASPNNESSVLSHQLDNHFSAGVQYHAWSACRHGERAAQGEGRPPLNY